MTSSPHLHGSAGEHLQRAVQAQLAVVEVDSALALVAVSFQEPPQPRWEEDAVRIDLHRPRVRLEDPILNHLGPDLDEDVSVQRRAELPAVVALQAHVHLLRPQARRHLDGAIAVNSRAVASEDGLPLRELHGEEDRLVAEWLHQGEAEEESGLWRQRAWSITLRLCANRASICPSTHRHEVAGIAILRVRGGRLRLRHCARAISGSFHGAAIGPRPRRIACGNLGAELRLGDGLPTHNGGVDGQPQAVSGARDA
mmetsp:Transcript_64448/g.185228  ORF Transcript_64448/g.185228 Transcript_64448/m.185228 type:complete len:255 (-) Transcript_64448:502-1266(-)